MSPFKQLIQIFETCLLVARKFLEWAAFKDNLMQIFHKIYGTDGIFYKL